MSNTGTKLERGHPRGLLALIATEIWERFGWYSVVGIFVPWLADAPGSGGLGMSNAAALSTLGIFGGVAYVAPLAGGAIADRIGHWRSAMLGSVALLLGYLTLTIAAAIVAAAGPGGAFRLVLPALAFLIVGTALFKPSISVMVGELYPPDDPRTDAGYTLFWTGINIGALLASIATGFLAEKVGWSFGFGAATIGMAIGLAIAAIRARDVRTAAPAAVDDIPSGATPLTVGERKGLVVMALFIVFAGLFNAAFLQCFGLVNIWMFERVDRHVLGYEIPVLWVLAINQLTILIAAPLFSTQWTRMARRGTNPSPAAKFTCAFVLLAGAFALLAVSAAHGGQGALGWIAIAIALMGLAEIFVQPVGLGLARQLAPARLAGLAMGGWFVAYGIANVASGQLGALATTIGELEVFRLITGGCVIAALLLFLARGWIRAWSGGSPVAA